MTPEFHSPPWLVVPFQALGPGPLGPPERMERRDGAVRVHAEGCAAAVGGQRREVAAASCDPVEEAVRALDQRGGGRLPVQAAEAV
jgi:hypothetical protein